VYDVQKLQRFFPATTVYKDPSVTAMFNTAKIPAFLRDWIIKRKAGADGKIDNLEKLSSYINTIIPTSKSKNILEDEARSNGETRKFLAHIEIAFNASANYYTFEIADLGFTHNQTRIEDYVWERVKNELIGEAGGWGLVKLGYKQPEGSKKNGKFVLLYYQNFCPYEVNVDAYREARSHFETSEWMDILLGAVDYNPDGFSKSENVELSVGEVWEGKHTLLTRLLPFVEPCVNLFELAPQARGKSYIFGKIGKYGWLASGGKISRAKLFYDIAKKQNGLVVMNDFVAIDEIKSIHFDDPLEMQGILKGYMEDGKATIGKTPITGSAGIILLGNIPVEDMDSSKDMLAALPDVFHDAALVDRFHGFIDGKKIPRINEAMKMKDWALNTEYFTEILHLLRAPCETLRYRGFVNQLIQHPDTVDTREKESIFRLCTAYLKLFFPHVNSQLINQSDFREEFKSYCLNPAKKMRETVLKQMKIMDKSQFKNKSLGTYQIKDIGV
jgi:ATP-dependent Lon protease